jgi:MFS family permease
MTHQPSIIRDKLIFFTLLLMVSFPIINAILFSPALPDIAVYFDISQHRAQQTMLWFLPGYALSQLLYAPLANYYGRKPALVAGILLQIASSLLCVAAGSLKLYPLLILARFLLALGSGVGLKMTFTFVNEYYQPQVVATKLSLILLAFTITPGVAVALGGLVNSYAGWQSCFYVCAIYGVLLLGLTTCLPETLKIPDKQALNVSVLTRAYRQQFSNLKLLTGGLLMGCANAFVYVFAAVAPFLAMNYLGMTSGQYGLYNLLPPLGLAAGLICSVKLGKKMALHRVILCGIVANLLGVTLLLMNLVLELSPLFALFLPMVVIYFGIGLVLPNASTLGLQQVSDKAYGAAVINFINIGVSACLILLLSLYSMQKFSLALIYFIICTCMLGIFKLMTPSLSAMFFLQDEKGYKAENK